MSMLDISILSVLAVSGLRGLFRGLVKEAAAIAAIFLGGLLAFHFHESAAVLLAGFLPLIAAKVVSFISLLLLVGLAAHLVGNLLTKIVKLALLGWVNRAGGLVLGLLEGALLLSIFFYGVTAVPFKSKLKENIEANPAARQLAAFGGAVFDRAKSVKVTLP